MSNPRVCYECKTKTANGRETQVKRNNSATRGQKSVAAGVAGDLLFGGSKRTKSAWKSKNAVSRAGGTHKTVWMCNSCLGESSSAAKSTAPVGMPKEVPNSFTGVFSEEQKDKLKAMFVYVNWYIDDRGRCQLGNQIRRLIEDMELVAQGREAKFFDKWYGEDYYDKGFRVFRETFDKELEIIEVEASPEIDKVDAPKVEETQDKPFQTFRDSYEEGKRQGEARVQAFEEKCKAFEEKCNNFSAKCDEVVANANLKRLNKAAALATMYVMYSLAWIIALGGVSGILQGELPLSDVPAFVIVGGVCYGIGRLCKKHSR